MVHDLEEFAAFQKTYGVQAAVPDDLFRTNVLLVLVGPGASGVGIEAVTQRRGEPLPEYYVDAYISGEDVEIAEPPHGKKYVFVEAVAVSKQVSEGKLYLRFPLCADGLSFKNAAIPIETTPKPSPQTGSFR